MKVTAKADYAVRAVLELATADGDLVKADRIAAAQGIPRHFLDNILTRMGGHRHSKSPLLRQLHVWTEAAPHPA